MCESDNTSNELSFLSKQTSNHSVSIHGNFSIQNLYHIDRVSGLSSNERNVSEPYLSSTKLTLL